MEESKGIFTCRFGDLIRSVFGSHYEKEDKNCTRKSDEKKVCLRQGFRCKMYLELAEEERHGLRNCN